jgi:hypothetical protein
MSEDAQIANLEAHRPNSNISSSKEILISKNAPISIEQAADAVGVPVIKVHRARAIQKHAPDLKDKVLQGKRKGGLSIQGSEIGVITLGNKVEKAAKSIVSTAVENFRDASGWSNLHLLLP